MAQCLAAADSREYGLVTDDSGTYAGMYRPYHLIGLELGISVAAVGLRREPTGRRRRSAAMLSRLPSAT